MLELTYPFWRHNSSRLFSSSLSLNEMSSYKEFHANELESACEVWKASVARIV